MANSAFQYPVTAGSGGVSEGLYASRPAAGTAGRVYLATDQFVLSYDTGSTWLEFPGGFQVGTLDEEVIALSPTSYYKCNEASGATTVTDYGSANKPLTYAASGNPAFAALYPRDPSGAYPLFNGTATVASASQNPTGVSVPNGDLTCMCFVVQCGAVTYMFALDNGSLSATVFAMGASASKPYFVLQSTGFTPADTGIIPFSTTDGRPLLYVAVKNSTAKTIKYYINGRYLGKASYTTEYSTSLTTPKITVGGGSGGVCDVIGGHFALWYGVQLTETQIRRLAIAAGVYCV